MSSQCVKPKNGRFLPLFTAFYPPFTLFGTHFSPTVSATLFGFPTLASLPEEGFTKVHGFRSVSKSTFLFSQKNDSTHILASGWGAVEQSFLRDSFSPRAHEYRLSHGKPEYSCGNFGVFF
jgi:hypothetical protein